MPLETASDHLRASFVPSLVSPLTLCESRSSLRVSWTEKRSVIDAKQQYALSVYWRHHSQMIFTLECKARSCDRMSSVRPSVRPSLTLVDCDHIGWNSSEIISPLVNLGCSLSANRSIRGLLQREHPEILAQSDQPPVDLSVGDIRSQIAAEWLQIVQRSQWTAYRKPPSLFRMVPSLTPLRPFLPPKWGAICSQDTRMAISPQRVIRYTSCLVQGRRIEWCYFRLHKIQVGSRPPSWIISNGRISSTAYSIHLYSAHRAIIFAIAQLSRNSSGLKVILRLGRIIFLEERDKPRKSRGTVQNGIGRSVCQVPVG